MKGQLRNLTLGAVGLLLLGPALAAAQHRQEAAGPYHEDWRSPERLTEALYSIVSGPATMPRDWPRYRALFHPTARLYNIDSASDSLALYAWTVEDYIAQLGPYFKTRGIWEREVAGRTERFAHLAHRWSTCEYRWERPDGPPSGRCIASLSFFHDGHRWWIREMSWEGESARYPIPRRYLPDVGAQE